MSTSRTREKADGELFKSTGIDDNATSTAVTIDASENVGIGESAPAQRLEVNELSQTAFTGIRVNNPNGNVGSAGIEFQVDGNYSKAAIFQKRGHANGGGDLIFAVDSSTDAANWVEGDEKLRITKAGNVTVNNGNLVIGTNGKGIDFSANADSSATGASTTSELLDDYEEGTWTPAFAGYTGTQPTIGSTQYAGTYTKIGNLVTLSAFLHAGSISGNTSEILVITGLPFDIATSGHVSGSHTSQNLNFVRPPVGSGLTGVVGGKLAFLTAVNNGAWAWELVSILGTSGYIDCDVRMTVTYRTT